MTTRAKRKKQECVLVRRSDNFAVVIDAVGKDRVAISTAIGGSAIGPALVLPRKLFEMAVDGWLRDYGRADRVD